ncbi:hypothetical protein AB1Y20_001899 [Prymnesium parvum]|uniref:Uncharacterized protein n=1 Tax=Prymnesium parvum TaxID=97485 RepID=A0AB34JA41_PRYPA|mmetsp:Transcript_27867/g.42028  ORF Transcript_27867/g.42028 Transcript_27867/m.42028 type:complete len:120 (+) Transcript_27867:17-376(+)
MALAMRLVLAASLATLSSALLCAPHASHQQTRGSTLVCAARPELTVCHGSVCVKHGSKAVASAAAKSGFAVKASSTCLKGCGKGVNVSAKGLGKRMLRECTDAAKARSATDEIARKFGL